MKQKILVVKPKYQRKIKLWECEVNKNSLSIESKLVKKHLREIVPVGHKVKLTIDDDRIVTEMIDLTRIFGDNIPDNIEEIDDDDYLYNEEK